MIDPDPTTEPADADPTTTALRTVTLGPDRHTHTRVKAAVTALRDVPPSGLTCAQEAAISPRLLRAVIAALGGSGVAIAADTRLRGILGEWAAVAAPRLFRVYTGHFGLAIGALLALGTGADYQQRCLRQLDTGDALGVLALTELGGTNGANQITTATWDPALDGFLLNTPPLDELVDAASWEAAKFMANLAEAADEYAQKIIVVVTARLIVQGRDEGVLPFLVELRADAGLRPGVSIVRLPDTDAPMAHAHTTFTDVLVSRDALLAGDWARIDAEGRFHCALAPADRFHRAISVLDNGRLDLATGTVASARAALYGLVNYTRQRRPGTGPMLADRDAVQLGLASGVAAVYAVTVLGRMLRELRADAAPGDPEQALWSMLAKPLLTDTAARWLLWCRRTAAAQGVLRINYLPDWGHNAEKATIAEGVNELLDKVAGRIVIDHPAPRLPGAPAQLPSYMQLMADRVRIIAEGLREGDYLIAGPVQGPDSAAMVLATATAEHLAATALLIAASTTADPTAAGLLNSMAAAYALDRINTHGAWYTIHTRTTGDQLAAINGELSVARTALVEALPTLVHAFAIPDLPAPLFAPDYLRAWADYTRQHTTARDPRPEQGRAAVRQENTIEATKTVAAE